MYADENKLILDQNTTATKNMDLIKLEEGIMENNINFLIKPMNKQETNLVTTTTTTSQTALLINNNNNNNLLLISNKNNDSDMDNDDRLIMGGGSASGNCGSSKSNELNPSDKNFFIKFLKKLLKSNGNSTGSNARLNYIKIIIPVLIVFMFLVFCFMFKDNLKKILLWIEVHQNSWFTFIIFLLLFTIVSFPVTIGYLVLIITSGYLFGFIKGLLTVILGANLGVAIAHNTIKNLQRKINIHKLIKNETGRAILRVISGPRAFKVVLFARLTPIPFGIQNTIFGVSAVNSRCYHTATILGLLPAQTINVYLGSTLRSMQDVLNDNKTALAGYCVFAIEVLVGLLLMAWVIQKAKTELSAALLCDMEIERKLLVEIES